MTHEQIAVQLTQSQPLQDPLRLAVIDVVHAYSGVYEITRINTPREHRGKGVARGLFAKCLTAADELGVALRLGPRSYDDGGLTTRQLVQWYMRHGFAPSQDTYLYRLPGGTNGDL